MWGRSNLAVSKMRIRGVHYKHEVQEFISYFDLESSDLGDFSKGFQEIHWGK